LSLSVVYAANVGGVVGVGFGRDCIQSTP